MNISNILKQYRIINNFMTLPENQNLKNVAELCTEGTSSVYPEEYAAVYAAGIFIQGLLDHDNEIDCVENDIMNTLEYIEDFGASFDTEEACSLAVKFVFALIWGWANTLSEE